MLNIRHILQDKTNGEWRDLSGNTEKSIGQIQTIVTNILSNTLLPNSDKNNQRNENKETWEYVHTLILKETGEKIQIIYLWTDNTKVKLIYAWKQYEISWEIFEALKPKLKEVYTQPVYHSNPDWTARWSWV